MTPVHKMSIQSAAFVSERAESNVKDDIRYMDT